ncbi:MAG: hypothetical protein LLG04_08135, partial [Parachlamydia sp.]|nr:hypothetical protein [Parachlamydia sp.]
MAYSVSWNNPYAAQNVPQGYQPKSHYNYVKEVGQVLKGQTDKIMAIWYNRDYSNGDAVHMEDGEQLFRNIFESRSGLVPEFLSLFSDENLRPIPDNIWYELANSHLSRGQVDAVRKELLRQHAPPPQLATSEAVNYFHQRVGGQPRQAPPSQAEVTASQHPQKAYRPKHPLTNIDDIAKVLRDQIDKLTAVWHNRGYTNKGPFKLYDDKDPGKGVFGNFVNCYV